LTLVPPIWNQSLYLCQHHICYSEKKNVIFFLN
jgi:hypothetical protein